MSNDDQVILKIDGEVASPRDFTFRQLSEVDHAYQLVDMSSVDPSRHGDAVRLEGLLDAVGARESAKFLGLHSSHDNFHASIPLAEVRERGFVIYRLDGHVVGVLCEEFCDPLIGLAHAVIFLMDQTDQRLVILRAG